MQEVILTLWGIFWIPFLFRCSLLKSGIWVILTIICSSKNSSGSSSNLKKGSSWSANFYKPWVVFHLMVSFKLFFSFFLTFFFFSRSGWGSWCWRGWWLRMILFSTIMPAVIFVRFIFLAILCCFFFSCFLDPLDSPRTFGISLLFTSFLLAMANVVLKFSQIKFLISLIHSFFYSFTLADSNLWVLTSGKLPLITKSLIMLCANLLLS